MILKSEQKKGEQEIFLNRFKNWTVKLWMKVILNDFKSERKLFLNDFKSERKLFLNDFKSERKLFLNDFKKWTKKVREQKLFLNDFRKWTEKGLWTETNFERF